MKIFGTIIFAMFFGILGRAQNGLMFNSNDSIIDKRTSYNVFQYQTPKFENHFYISFDFSIWDTQNLGYIFNLITQNNSYSLNYLFNEKGAQLNFNINSKSNKLYLVLDSSLLKQQTWWKIKFDFDLKNDIAIANINGHVYKIYNLRIPNPVNVKLIFGKTENYTEVPQMAIRNLTVGGEKNLFLSSK